MNYMNTENEIHYDYEPESVADALNWINSQAKEVEDAKKEEEKCQNSK